MASDSSGLRTQILATVIGGLLLSGTLWLLGVVPPILTWFGQLAQRLWRILTTDLAIPVWAIAVALGLAVAVTIALGRKGYRNPGTSESVRQHPQWYSRPDDPVGQIADRILRELLAADGDTILRLQFEATYQDNRLRLDEALSRLQAAHLIMPTGGYGAPVEIQLTPLGRRHVLDRGIP